MSNDLSQNATIAIELLDDLVTRYAKPELVGHLMDSDDNAAEYVRRAIRELDDDRSEVLKEAMKSTHLALLDIRRFNNLMGALRTTFVEMEDRGHLTLTGYRTLLEILDGA